MALFSFQLPTTRHDASTAACASTRATSIPSASDDATRPDDAGLRIDLGWGDAAAILESA
jgi:hypothetical protein